MFRSNPVRVFWPPHGMKGLREGAVSLQCVSSDHKQSYPLPMRGIIFRP